VALFHRGTVQWFNVSGVVYEWLLIWCVGGLGDDLSVILYMASSTCGVICENCQSKSSEISTRIAEEIMCVIPMTKLFAK
jgi:hypothetical protein